MVIKSFDELPIMLSAKHIKDILGISKSRVYEIFHSEGFPLVSIDKRLLVNKESFKKWLEAKEGKFEKI